MADNERQRVLEAVLWKIDDLQGRLIHIQSQTKIKVEQILQDMVNKREEIIGYDREGLGVVASTLLVLEKLMSEKFNGAGRN